MICNLYIVSGIIGKHLFFYNIFFLPVNQYIIYFFIQERDNQIEQINVQETLK